jgi:hypothetical protein
MGTLVKINSLFERDNYYVLPLKIAFNEIATFHVEMIKINSFTEVGIIEEKYLTSELTDDTKVFSYTASAIKFP